MHIPAVLMGAVVVSNLLLLALHAYFLNYMDRLRARGCACALGWQQRFIEATLVVFVIATLVHLGMVLTGSMQHRSGPYEVVQALLFALMVAYVVVSRMFLQRMAKIDCTCARGVAYDALNVVNAVYIAALVLYALLLIFVMVGRAQLAAATVPSTAPKSVQK